MVQKPTTMLMDEFKEKLIDLLNNAQLPAWVMLYLLEPFIEQLKQFDEATKIQDRENYEKALEVERNEKTEE